MIPESFIQELLARVDIVDVVGRYVQLRKAGANLLGLCPFHDEKTPSFTVSPGKQFYHCFGCGAHGSAIRFLTEHTGASFPEAVRTLAGSVGMLVPEEPKNSVQRARERVLRTQAQLQQEILEQARDYYKQSLKHADDAIQYLKNRGLSGAVAARFGIGWAGNDRRGLATVFANYHDQVMLDSGLVLESDDGQRYDRFRARLMFPISNHRGQLIGFGGRLIRSGEPKYLNSPETQLFSKGNELYALFDARQGIRSEGFVLVVEGYMDVVSLAEHGLNNAVATLGTATTAVHLQKLVRASNRIVFSFDGDKAGKKAAWSALQACLPGLSESVSINFLFLPDSHDPDSFIRAYGVAALREAIQTALPLSGFLLGELANRHDLTLAEGRAACVHEARGLFALMSTGGLRIQIENEFARLVRLTPEELQNLLQQQVRPKYGFGNDTAQGLPDSSQQAAMAGKSLHAPGRAARKLFGKRAVTPMARRLLKLLLMHPDLIASLGEQQLELLSNHPNMQHVGRLIALQVTTNSQHTGALLQAAAQEPELQLILQDLTVEVLDDDLPNPQAELNDALRNIELQALEDQSNALAHTGLTSQELRLRYQDLHKRIAQLKSWPR